VTPAGGHRKRHVARRTAIDVLYEADVMNRAPATVLDEWRAAGRSIPEYTAELVRDVAQRISDIDGVLAAHSEEWPVHRMAVVDRTILRVACAEMASGLPAAVAINEAVTIASELASDDSGRFINGILGRVAREMGAGNGEGSPGDGDRPHTT
jgi:N utilization substance protein B